MTDDQLPEGMTCGDCGHREPAEPGERDGTCGKVEMRADDPACELFVHKREIADYQARAAELTRQLKQCQERCRALEREAEEARKEIGRWSSAAQKMLQDRLDARSLNAQLWDGGVKLAREIESWQRAVIGLTREKYQALVEVDQARAELRRGGDYECSFAEPVSHMIILGAASKKDCAEPCGPCHVQQDSRCDKEDDWDD